MQAFVNGGLCLAGAPLGALRAIRKSYTRGCPVGHRADKSRKVRLCRKGAPSLASILLRVTGKAELSRQGPRVRGPCAWEACRSAYNGLADRLWSKLAPVATSATPAPAMPRNSLRVWRSFVIDSYLQSDFHFCSSPNYFRLATKSHRSWASELDRPSFRQPSSKPPS